MTNNWFKKIIGYDEEEEKLKEQARKEVAESVKQEKLELYKAQMREKELQKAKEGKGLSKLATMASKLSKNAAKEFGYSEESKGFSGLASKADSNLQRMLGKSSQQPSRISPVGNGYAFDAGSKVSNILGSKQVIDEDDSEIEEIILRRKKKQRSYFE